MCASITNELAQAYRDTHYLVKAEPTPFTLRIDQPSASLGALYDRLDVRSAAFLTAFNPYSAPTSAARNATAQVELACSLRSAGVPWIAGIGIDPNGQWPGEPSLLALGPTLALSRRLAAEYRQNAFVWCAEDAVPRLILMR